MMFFCADTEFLVEFEDNIGKEESTEEYESFDCKELKSNDRKKNTQDSRSCNTKKNCFFLVFLCELLRRKTDEYSIVCTHDDINHDDIYEHGKSCRSKEIVPTVSKTLHDSIDKFFHKVNDYKKESIILFFMNYKVFEKQLRETLILL